MRALDDVCCVARLHALNLRDMDARLVCMHCE
jgi:hypothetical protein